jgi:NADP-dependent 3-hydroxy acid dehydrogenase YdfG
MARKQARNLNGGVVAITGAARGIGRATAKLLTERGMKVAIGDVDLATAEATASEIGRGTLAFHVDVTSRDSVRGFIHAVETAAGPLDVLINNAGIMPLSRLAHESDERAERMIDINVNGVLYGMKEILPRFTGRGRGHIVNIASTAGKAGWAGGATYCGTKAFVVVASESVRMELKGTGVEISCVMPGVVNTELAAGLHETRGVQKIEPEDVAAAIAEVLEQPRFDVFVPKSIGPIGAFLGLFPRSVREAAGRGFKADKLLDDVDDAARASYEARTSGAPPAAPEREPEPAEQATTV